MNFNSIEDIVADIRQGKMVVLVDDEDRENEGDLIMASQMVRPEDINFMAKHARGLICMTLTQERCQQLNIPLMVRDNGTPFATNFTLSIEAAEGVTTGISAADRAHTIQVAVNRQTKSTDLVQPGHVFPVMAQPGGVLKRAGHTEAGCDLARLAGFEPSSVIVEIMNEDGSMARREDLVKFAAVHALKIGTIADLIQYRLHNENTIDRIETSEINTRFGKFGLVLYKDQTNGERHIALVKGVISPDTPVLVRVHVLNPLRDVLGVYEQSAEAKDKRWSLPDAMAFLNKAGEGVVVLLSSGETKFELAQQVEQMLGINEVKSHPKSRSGSYVTIGTGSQILKDLGVSKMRLMSNPVRYSGISGFGLEVVEFISNDD